MSSMVAFYRDKKDGLYIGYVADFSEGKVQDLVTCPSPESLDLQSAKGDGDYCVVFHQTKGLMRQVIRAAVSDFFHYKKKVTLDDIKNSFVPFLFDSMRDGLELPNQSKSVFDLCLVVGQACGICQIRSDGTVVSFRSPFFSEKSLELNCRQFGPGLSVNQIRQGLAQASTSFYGGIQINRMTISGLLKYGQYEISDWRGDQWGFLRPNWKGDGTIVCEHV